MNDIIESRLTEGIIRGDINSYRQLFEDKYSLFYSFVRGMVKDSFAAEDITQNIFMKVWVNRKKLTANQSIHNYLYVLARNEVRDFFRRKSNLRSDELKEDIRSFVDDIEGAIDSKMIKSKVDSVVFDMPDQRRRIFLLSREDNLSNKEIAEKMNLSVRTVERHILLAIKDIRKVLPVFYLFIYTFLIKNI